MVLYQKIFIRGVFLTLRSLYLIFLLLLEPTILTANQDDNQTKKENESFLSLLEYGKMLYKNPRGISCSKCHGLEGKGGKKIAKYFDKHKNIKLLKSTNITNYSLEELKASLKNKYRKNGKRKRHKIMPIYYMTEEEILAIFTYLESQREE